ncbi:MAG: response regulator transcription factor [Bacillus subtilis]|nr:response regulator transcription factor [Bacillus subtilis]
MRLIIVEDEKQLNDVLFDYLTATFPSAVIDQVFDGDDAMERLIDQTYDLVLLDVMLPGTDGFAIAKSIRATSNTPILMMSAYSDEENQIRGYNLGIDEFVKKPYSPRLVMKKVEAILQRTNATDDLGYETIGVLKVNLTKRKLLVNDVETHLNHNEWELLHVFVHNKGIALSRDTLLTKVWGYDYDGDERTVDTHIKRLRQKLGSAAEYIKTIHKIGYQFSE